MLGNAKVVLCKAIRAFAIDIFSKRMKEKAGNLSWEHKVGSVQSNRNWEIFSTQGKVWAWWKRKFKPWISTLASYNNDVAKLCTREKIISTHTEGGRMHCQLHLYCSLCNWTTEEEVQGKMLGDDNDTTPTHSPWGMMRWSRRRGRRCRVTLSARPYSMVTHVARPSLPHTLYRNLATTTSH